MRHVLDELRLRETYTKWASAAAQETAVWTAYADVDYATALQDAGYLESEQLAATGRDVKCNAEWAFDAGFENAEGVREALLRAAVFRDVRRRIESALERLPSNLAVPCNGDT